MVKSVLEQHHVGFIRILKIFQLCLHRQIYKNNRQSIELTTSFNLVLMEFISVDNTANLLNILLMSFLVTSVCCFSFNVCKMNLLHFTFSLLLVIDLQFLIFVVFCLYHGIPGPLLRKQCYHHLENNNTSAISIKNLKFSKVTVNHLRAK